MSEPQRPKVIVDPTLATAGDVERRLGELFEVVFLPTMPGGPGPDGGLGISARPPPDGSGSARESYEEQDGDGAQAVILPPGQLRRLVTSHSSGMSDLLNAIGQGVAWVDGQGTVLWANGVYQQLPAGVREGISQLCRGTTAGGDAIAPRWRAELASDGEQTVYEVTLTVIPGQDEPDANPAAPGPGTAPGARLAERGVALAALVRDVSSDRRLQRKMDAIDRAGAELVGIDADVVRRMNAQERLEFLEDKIVRTCRDLLQFDHFIIRLIDERSGRLEQVFASGLPPEASELDIYPRAEGNGISGYVAATGQSYICHDTEKDPRFLPGLAGARSSLTVPLRLSDRVIGTLDVESQQPGRFSEDDRQFGEIFARYIAMALRTLQVLVVERTATNQTVSRRVEGEISEPLSDILRELETLRRQAGADGEVILHLDRIKEDVEAVHRRIRNVTSGPQTLLGIEDEMAQRRRDPVLEGRRLLVADDDNNMRRLIHDILINRGSTVVAHASGVGAIAAMEGVAAGRVEAFDAVLSDIKMPDKNGYDVFAAARRLQPGIPVILMTGFGYDPHHSIVRASQEGLQSVLFKPFQVDRLLDEVRKAVGNRPREKQQPTDGEPPLPPTPPDSPPPGPSPQ